ncbi:MAG TPA: hypothetical protein VNF27_00575 [Candidatus Binataceae bacterium]|nr:hypothetical protein [Candidatus Binataceae bacterium]
MNAGEIGSFEFAENLPLGRDRNHFALDRNVPAPNVIDPAPSKNWPGLHGSTDAIFVPGAKALTQ